MTYYLRDEKNKTLVDIDLWIAKGEEHSYVEISCSIDILNYSMLLLKLSKEKEKDMKWQKFILDFDKLSEVRGWLWETYFASKKNNPTELDNVTKEIQTMLKEIANRYNLYLMTD